MYRIGIDLGGTNIAAGIVNEEFKIVAKASVPTHAERPAEEMVRNQCSCSLGTLEFTANTAIKHSILSW